jgi:hypothetical protein
LVGVLKPGELIDAPGRHFREVGELRSRDSISRPGFHVVNDGLIAFAGAVETLEALKTKADLVGDGKTPREVGR